MTGIYGEIDGYRYSLDNLDVRIYMIEASGHEGAQDIAQGILQKMYESDIPYLQKLKNTRHRLYDTYSSGTVSKQSGYECYNVIFECVQW